MDKKLIVGGVVGAVVVAGGVYVAATRGGAAEKPAESAISVPAAQLQNTEKPAGSGANGTTAAPADELAK